ncbi:ATP-dependent DNA helicase [Psychrobium sp. 1_MG-2023]|uniref:ATP-dependent DNA helicase n=1 Tax=Psychrobium sp. 1_MG-2023 TaxID=3062624 RepID=UPI000C324591|nr:ATP-dependent DNA helicase [Psychrobium sp. 1_MG-2023]MDP2562189.1 ATP-dependent DNA helicase [Psychrobium sp. 1_MG-2023]PKF58107.1 ATP-dependent helicase [Alteromonadales bacterium alter-6D02]
MKSVQGQIANAFSSDGALAKAIDGYQERQVQTTMALAIGEVVPNQEKLVVEAQTGTGKTFAYLISAILSGAKTIVSTGTKALQEQLYYKDLPVVREALNKPLKTALLKGRSNYLCIERLKKQQAEGASGNEQLAHDLGQIKRWSAHTVSGDLGEVPGVNESSFAFPLVTSTADNCSGRKCKYYDDCYLLRARRKAMEADLIVVNHHLFFADMALKDTGFGELIPESELVIFDEAHQIPDIACGYFGQSLSTRTLKELASDVAYVYYSELKDTKQLLKAAQIVERCSDQLRLCFSHQGERGNWHEALKRQDIHNAFEQLSVNLDFLYQVIKISLGRSDTLDNCFERLLELKTRFDLFKQSDKLGFSFWFEANRLHLQLNISPLSIADKFTEHMKDLKTAWLFTSATLKVDDSFEHFNQQLGLTDVKTLSLASPFDYQQQSMFCVPRYLPEPANPQYIDALAQTISVLTQASNGGVLILVTSFSTLNRLQAMLSTQLSQQLLVQGSDSKQNLLKQFANDGHAVLLATASFWEGVDIRGDALRCVIIDKLPFASPDDPLLKARLDDKRKQGIEGFDAVQIPQAVIALKQGAGRLIRDQQDRGVLVLCDTRIISRPYGRVFLQSLPDMKRTRDIKQVINYLENISA